jgi:hypothetical protein
MSVQLNAAPKLLMVVFQVNFEPLKVLGLLIRRFFLVMLHLVESKPAHFKGHLLSMSTTLIELVFAYLLFPLPFTSLMILLKHFIFLYHFAQLAMN